jgi:hypothetical protein
MALLANCGVRHGKQLSSMLVTARDGDDLMHNTVGTETHMPWLQVMRRWPSPGAPWRDNSGSKSLSSSKNEHVGTVRSAGTDRL